MLKKMKEPSIRNLVIKFIALTCVIQLMGCGKTASSDEHYSFYLTIGAGDVRSIEISTACSSGGCENADGSLYKKGEKVWLETIDGFQDLRGVALSALGENGDVIWEISVPDDGGYEGILQWKDGEWAIVSNSE